MSSDIERTPIMSSSYKIDLLNGSHGIWLFVTKENKIIFEQAGLKSVEEALQYALSTISYQEKV